MLPHEIDAYIDRARKAWLRRPEFNGKTAKMADSDIEYRNGKDIVVLRDGDEIVAQFRIRQRNGELRYIH